MTHRKRLERMRDEAAYTVATTERHFDVFPETGHGPTTARIASERDALQWALDEIDRLTAAVNHPKEAR